MIPPDAPRDGERLVLELLGAEAAKAGVEADGEPAG